MLQDDAQMRGFAVMKKALSHWKSFEKKIPASLFVQISVKNIKKLNGTVYLRPFLLPDNGRKNSILNWVLKLNLMQQCVMCHFTEFFILHAYFLLRDWKCVLFTFRDYAKQSCTKLNKNRRPSDLQLHFRA